MINGAEKQLADEGLERKEVLRIHQFVFDGFFDELMDIMTAVGPAMLKFFVSFPDTRRKVLRHGS